MASKRDNHGRMVRVRFGSFVVVVLACGPAKEPPTADGTTTGETTAVPTTGAGPGTTTGASTGTGAGTGTTGEPGSQTWVGTYDSGFAYSYFTPCGETNGWLIEGSFPAYESCINGPIWVRMTGTTYEDPELGTMFKVESYEGPCLEGSCEAGPGPGLCDSFDGLCMYGSEECHPIFQNCPDGLKCIPSPATCVPVDPNAKGLGEACVGGPADDCGANALCAVDDAMTGEGVCQPMCGGSYGEPTCDDLDRVCVRDPAVCLPGCDPLAAGCPDAQACTPNGDQPFFCLPAPAAVPLGGECYSGDCVDGLVCVSSDLVPCAPDATGCCAAWCELGAPCEAPGTECVTWWQFLDPPPGLEQLGVCRFPG